MYALLSWQISWIIKTVYDQKYQEIPDCGPEEDTDMGQGFTESRQDKYRSHINLDNFLESFLSILKSMIMKKKKFHGFVLATPLRVR